MKTKQKEENTRIRENRESEQKEEMLWCMFMIYLCSSVAEAVLYKQNLGPCPVNLQFELGGGKN